MYDDFLMHVGVAHDENPPGRGSGRWPYGSGPNAYQRPKDFLERVERLRRQGLTDKKIAEEVGLLNYQGTGDTTALKAQIDLEKHYKRMQDINTARQMAEEGKNPYEIGRYFGRNESTIRGWLKEGSDEKINQAFVTAEYLKGLVDSKGMVDVTSGGTEILLGNISTAKLNESLYILQEAGYPHYSRRFEQVTNKGQFTTQTVLCPPGTEYKDIYKKDVKVASIEDYDKILTDDGTKIRPAFEYPASVDSKRVAIKYAEQGGITKDGVIEIRPGVADLSLGNSHYAQVRILVDGTHYIKGMAMYSDKLPEGKDILFNTNKHEGTPMCGPKNNTVLKPIVSPDKDPENPFGSLIKERGGQSHYIGEDGKEHLSAINKRSDEGDWSDWSDKVPNQFLSKQPLSLIKKQLKATVDDYQKEYDEIMLLTNPTVKKKMLMDFAATCDKNAVELKSSPFPGQKYKVLLPVDSLKETEVFAPGYENGEQLALIRYPHAGRFEIPVLTVNNKNREASSYVGKDSQDAVGINHRVAEQLSGADYDGDTAMVIPMSRTKIAAKPRIDELVDFEPKQLYKDPEGTFKPMTDTQKQMGMISNLITDMTIKGAKPEELIRAVKHSMVVIDAEKHGLNWQRSEKENGIKELRDLYMGHYDEEGNYSTGASTIISAAKSEYRVPKRQGSPKVNQKGKPWYDPKLEEGALIYKTAEQKIEYNPKTGKPYPPRMTKSTRMAETNDAFTLVSEFRAPQELEYASFANQMKSMANQARKDAVYTENTPYSPQAKIVYATEVAQLKADLSLAKLNKPKENAAQRNANAILERHRDILKETDATEKEIKKEIDDLRQRVLTQERSKVGAKRYPIPISDREWEAIQAGAVSSSLLSEILQYANPDRVKELATPRTTKELSSGKKARMRSLLASGLTIAQVANAIGVSTSTVSRFIQDEKGGADHG